MSTGDWKPKTGYKKYMPKLQNLQRTKFRILANTHNLKWWPTVIGLESASKQNPLYPFKVLSITRSSIDSRLELLEIQFEDDTIETLTFNTAKNTYV